jgi:hypothetical protein
MFIMEDKIMNTWTIFDDDGCPIIEDFETKEEAEKVARKL